MQKQNIQAPVLEGPKVVGKIDLGGNQPAPIAKKFVVFGNFPIEHYDRILELVKKVNNKLGKDSVTISKLAKIKGVVSEKHCSVWFSCDENSFRSEFLSKVNIMLVEAENNCKRITKEKALNMPYGQSFIMCYLFKDGNMKASPCVRIFSSKKEEKNNICYTKVRDTNQNVNLLTKDSINEDGTFKADKATGYLFVSNETFVGDL
jgi:hypothetical protein